MPLAAKKWRKWGGRGGRDEEEGLLHINRVHVRACAHVSSVAAAYLQSPAVLAVASCIPPFLGLFLIPFSVFSSPISVVIVFPLVSHC